MIYLDNSATTYPKPYSVIDAVNSTFTKYGANSGRSGYKMALETSNQIYDCRKKVADFFNAPDIFNVIFTQNCTTALNMAIKGLAKQNAHFIISDLEHNAVLRPIHKLFEQGFCTYTVCEIDKDKNKTIKNFENAINNNTVAIICTGASNVFGIMPPIKEISELAFNYKIKFIVDSAQIAGLIPIDISKCNIDILCCAGHKGLYSPAGIGIMVLKDNIKMNTIIEGGTGSVSSNFSQPDFIPDKFESGTPNISGILGLSAGIDFINNVGIVNIKRHEEFLIDFLYNNIKDNKNIKVYKSKYFDYSPILSLNINGFHSEEVANLLSQEKICVRAGLHCAPLAHKKMKTIENGTVRISPSYFTKKEDIIFLIKCLNKIAK